VGHIYIGLWVKWSTGVTHFQCWYKSGISIQDHQYLLTLYLYVHCSFLDYNSRSCMESPISMHSNWSHLPLVASAYKLRCNTSRKTCIVCLTHYQTPLGYSVRIVLQCQLWYHTNSLLLQQHVISAADVMKGTDTHSHHVITLVRLNHLQKNTSYSI